jgi:hypothetical protein
MDYQPLNSNRDEIRLLNIQDDASAELTCTVAHASLSSQPSFKAISYCWGEEKTRQKLQSMAKKWKSRRSLTTLSVNSDAKVTIRCGPMAIA